MRLKLVGLLGAALMITGTAYASDCCKEGAECCKKHKDCCDHDKPAPKVEDHDHQ